ncbi:MAG: hypothetical protein WBD25_14300 [Terriglobales bacterium]
MKDEEVQHGAGSDHVEQVQPDEILQKGLGDRVLGLDKASGRVLEPLQRVGYRLALFVLGYIFIASIAIFIVSFYLVRLPPVPASPSSSGDAEHYKQFVDAYKESSEIYQQMAKAQVDRAIQLFQLVVASTILPAFTAILGYIFGSKKSGE